MNEWMIESNSIKNFKSAQYEYRESKEQVSADWDYTKKAIDDVLAPLYSNILMRSIQIR